MPLINLTSDLKTLQYGGDRPGGGSSGLPYIISPRPDQIVPLPFPLKPDEFTNFYELNRNTQDYPIRGGSIELDSETGYPTTPAGMIDRSRIRAFLEDKQRGSIFLLKQTGLQLTNPKIQVPGTLGTSNILETTRAYNPTGRTTLAQVVTQGTGIHLTRHGLIPLYTGIFEGTYEDVVKRNNGEDTNRLAVLAKSKLSSDSPIYAPYINKAIDYGISFLNNQILNYPGGPGSTYGIGETIIKRATNTNTSRVYNSIAFSYDTIMKQAATRGNPALPPEDFRVQVNQQSPEKRQMVADYAKNGIEARLSTGNPASPGLDRKDYKNTSFTTQDQLNTLNPFYYFAASNLPWEAPGVADDMIKFVFECMSNDNPGNAVALFFRSFLTSFTDNNQAEYNSFKYLGRGETFRTYQGFDRSISFGFKIAAFTRAEMKPLYTKLNHLVSQAYPDYSPQSRFMRGSVIQLTIGDYLYRVPGFLENINITVDQNVSWEIALNDSEMRELPQVIDVQCTFKPIHSILPRREKFGDGYVPLIANTPKPFLNKLIETKNFSKPNVVVEATESDRNKTFAPGTSGYYDPVTKTITP